MKCRRHRPGRGQAVGAAPGGLFVLGVLVGFLAANAGLVHLRGTDEFVGASFHIPRMRCVMYQVDFCVMPRSRYSFMLDMPFGRVL